MAQAQDFKVLNFADKSIGLHGTLSLFTYSYGDCSVSKFLNFRTEVPTPIVKGRHQNSRVANSHQILQLLANGLTQPPQADIISQLECHI